MILLLSYDLNEHEPADEYECLIDAIKYNAGEGNYVKALYSQWFVDTSLSISQWNNIMKDATDDNDSRMVIELTRKPTGKYKKEAIDWINTRLSSF